MVFIVRLLLIGVLSFIFSLFSPWWMIVLIAAIVSFIMPGNNFSAFLGGLLGAGIVWMVMAWKVDADAASLLSDKIVKLFPVDESSMLVLLTGAIGGIAGGLGAFTGNSFRQIFIKKVKQSFYS
ncbi:MAG: hypothetical protein OCD76_21055 [Reichenbachiella sp.]